MNLNELFQKQGLGVMATASKDGAVNTAVYARPHVIDEQTMVWGMPELDRICLNEINVTAEPATFIIRGNRRNAQNNYNFWSITMTMRVNRGSSAEIFRTVHRTGSVDLTL